MSKELSATPQAHDEFVKVQNENWKIVEEQFDVSLEVYICYETAPNFFRDNS